MLACVGSTKAAHRRTFKRERCVSSCTVRIGGGGVILLAGPTLGPPWGKNDLWITLVDYVGSHWPKEEAGYATDVSAENQKNVDG